jgi:hypothetical protein
MTCGVMAWKALANLLRKLGHEAESIAAEEKKPGEKK